MSKILSTYNLMAIVVQNNNNNEGTPFDSIRRVDEHGNEYWYARELMPLLGYKTWERVPNVIDRAKTACLNVGNRIEDHFFEEVRKTSGRPQQDFKLSRYSCYLVAMNGDSRKPEIAAAQSYFAVSTHEAETKRKLEQQQDVGLLNPVYNEALKVHNDVISDCERRGDYQLAQLLKSSLANIVARSVQALPSADKPVVEQYESAVEVATRLGYRVPPNYESSLGGAVSKVCGELIRERNQRWSSTSGIKVPANMYPAYNPDVEDAVESYCIKKGFYRRPDLKVV
jgi:hypothetical protein